MWMWVSQKNKYLTHIPNFLNRYVIYKIIDFHRDYEKNYMAFIYVKTDQKLKSLTDSEREKIKSIYKEFLKEILPYKIENYYFYFDSDENVQKNYKGNYFYATR